MRYLLSTIEPGDSAEDNGLPCQSTTLPPVVVLAAQRMFAPPRASVRLQQNAPSADDTGALRIFIDKRYVGRAGTGNPTSAACHIRFLPKTASCF